MERIRRVGGKSRKHRRFQELTHHCENFEIRLRGEENQRQRVARGRAEMQNQRRVRTDGAEFESKQVQDSESSKHPYITRMALSGSQDEPNLYISSFNNIPTQ